MPRVAFFLDELDYHSASIADPDFPRANAVDDRPGVEFCHPTDPLTYPQGGQFDIDTDNMWLDTDLGSVSVGIGARTIPEILTELNAGLQAIDATFLVEYGMGGARFRITRGAGNFSLLWTTGAHVGSNMGEELGFDTSADQTGYPGYAGATRTATHTWVAFYSSTAVAAHLAVAILRADGQDVSSGDGVGDYTDVKLYSMTTIPGVSTRLRFAAAATGTYSFSTRSDEPDAEMQVALPAGATTKKWWVISWRHLDEAMTHRVGLARVYTAPLQSSTRTVRAMRGHGLMDRTQPLGMGAYWTPRLGQAWRMPLTFDSWPVSDWRTVGHAVVRWGPARPLVVALNWQGLTAGTLTGLQEVERGNLLYASLAEVPSDDYQGQGSDYITASMTLEQVR